MPAFRRQLVFIQTAVMVYRLEMEAEQVKFPPSQVKLHENGATPYSECPTIGRGRGTPPAAECEEFG